MYLNDIDINNIRDKIMDCGYRIYSIDRETTFIECQVTYEELMRYRWYMKIYSDKSTISLTLQCNTETLTFKNIGNHLALESHQYSEKEYYELAELVTNILREMDEKKSKEMCNLLYGS